MEIVGATAWMALGGLALLVATSARGSRFWNGRAVGRYVLGFAGSAVAGEVVSLGIERFTTLHTCHFVTLGFAMLGGAVFFGGRGALRARWMTAKILATATIAILVLPWFLGAGLV